MFDYDGHALNLLAMHGHADSPKTPTGCSRRSTARSRLLDSAKGLEPQTLKLFDGPPVVAVPAS